MRLLELMHEFVGIQIELNSSFVKSISDLKLAVTIMAVVLAAVVAYTIILQLQINELKE